MSFVKRDYNAEARDNEHRSYAYDFDSILRVFMMRQFKPFLKSGRALELGCYKGEFTAMLAANYADLTVVEAADELIAEAKSRVPKEVQFLHSTFEEVQLDQRYDAIFLVHTLEHLDDPVSILRRIDSWLTPTGALYVVVPNANAPSRQIAVSMGLVSHNAAVTEAERLHGHRITYSLDTLERDVVASGLTILAQGGVFFKPFANFQFDKLIKTDIISEEYLEGCFQLGMKYPDLSASIYFICGKGT